MQFRLSRCFKLLVPLWLLPVVLPATVIGLPKIASAQVDATNARTEALAIYEQAVQLQQAGRYQEALDQYGQALTIFRQLGEQQAEGAVLSNIGLIYDNVGQYQQALDYYSEAFAIQQVLSDSQNARISLTNIAAIYEVQGYYQQALSTYTEALNLQQPLEDPAGDANILTGIGLVHQNLGDYPQALASFTEALALQQSVNDLNGESNTLNSIGTVYGFMGDYPQALSYFMDALALQQQLNSPRGLGNTLNNIGFVYEVQGDYPQALNYYNEALSIQQATDDYRGQGTTLNNIGSVYAAQGSYQLAFATYDEALNIQQAINDPRGEGTTLNSIGAVHEALGQNQDALDYYAMALSLQRAINDPRGTSSTLSRIGTIYQNLEQYEIALEYYSEALSLSQDIEDPIAQGDILNNIGLVYQKLDQYSQAFSYYTEALVISQALNDRPGEGTTLNNIGVAHQNLRQYPESLDYYARALTIRQEIGDREGEAITLNNMGFVLEALDEPELAIVFFKASVNQWESIRGEIRELETAQQQSFIDRISMSYRRLADLLLRFDRVLEAQEVLDLLKLQELQEYALPNVEGTSETQTGLALWPAEQALLDAFTTEFAQSSGPNIDAFLQSPNVITQVEQLQRLARGQNLNPEQLAPLQDNLRQAGNAALLYPLILEDRLELILVTPSGLIRETVPVSGATLDAALTDFRMAITNRRSNPTTQAEELYQWLIAPIANHLDQAGIETLLYAADGPIRYIPLAALYDGEQWLAQRYTLNHITAASLTDFSRTGTANLDVLAGAFPEDAMQVMINGDPITYSGLPYAQAEVDYLVETIPNTTAFFDNAFSREAIEARFNNYSIIHFATHAEFRSGHPNDSYILLGDGDRITLADLNQWNLPNVNLVVLSACKTAVGATDLGNGEEILGFGYQIQQTGADAAIASLWYVDDSSTQALMTTFYEALRGGNSEAMALRQAQLALISDSSLSHPYFWAPFILIGNGL